jgi:hypothetical protein
VLAGKASGLQYPAASARLAEAKVWLHHFLPAMQPAFINLSINIHLQLIECVPRT